MSRVKARILGRPIGSAGDLTFHDSRIGKRTETIMKSKGGVEKSRILTDPQFANTRNNMSEMGYAGAVSKQIKAACNLVAFQDKNLIARITSALRLSANNDSVNEVGSRKADFSDGSLVGIKTNVSSSLQSVIRKPLTFAVDLEDVTLTIPALTPKYHIMNQPEATHCKIKFVAVTIAEDLTPTFSTIAETDFISTTSSDELVSETLALEGVAVEGTNYACVAAVEFYKEVNGTKNLLKNKNYNAGAIVGAGAA